MPASDSAPGATPPGSFDSEPAALDAAVAHLIDPQCQRVADQ
jgi:hypothetical protein